MASCKWTMANIFLLSYLHDDFFLPSDRRHGLYAAGQHGCRFVRCRTLCIERKRLDTHRCDGSFLGALQLRCAAKAAHTDFATSATSATFFKEEQQPSALSGNKVYLPIASTLRLYAGWLLAYYSIVYALGWYAQSRPLTFEIPYVRALLVSPLVLSFTFAAFLFLLFHSLYRLVGGGLVKGVAVSVLGVVVFAVYRMNVV